MDLSRAFSGQRQRHERDAGGETPWSLGHSVGPRSYEKVTRGDRMAMPDIPVRGGITPRWARPSRKAPRAAPQAAPGERTVRPWSGVDEGQRAVRGRDVLPGRVAPIGQELAQVGAVNLGVEVDVAAVGQALRGVGDDNPRCSTK